MDARVGVGDDQDLAAAVDDMLRSGREQMGLAGACGHHDGGRQCINEPGGIRLQVI